MAEQDKGKFSADIGQDVIEEALRSVRRREGGTGGDGEQPSDVAPAAPSGEEGVTLDAEGGASVPTELSGAAEAPPAPAEGDAQHSDLQKELQDGLQKEVEALKAQLEFSQEKGRELMAKVKEEHERLLRANADLDNYRKRAVKEKEEVQRFGIEKLLKDFFPVVDNLDRALDHAKSPADFESLVQGIRMTKKLFEDALGKHGVKGFVSKGKPFDPRVHEAMQQVETEELPPNHVYQEVLRGFMLHDRLARPALVMVTKAPEKRAEPAAAAATEQSGDGQGDGGSAAS